MKLQIHLNTTALVLLLFSSSMSSYNADHKNYRSYEDHTAQ